MAANNIEETQLMFLEQEKVIIPVSTKAFHVTQNNKRGLARYEGALLISRDGKLTHIKHIEVVGVWGDSVLRKILSLLTGARRIRTEFETTALIDISSLKRIVKEYLKYDGERAEPFLPQQDPLDKVLVEVQKASTIKEIFDHINVPDPQNALDVL